MLMFVTIVLQGHNSRKNSRHATVSWLHYSATLAHVAHSPQVCHKPVTVQVRATVPMSGHADLWPEW